MRRSPLRVLCYAVNGLGLGHLTRLVAVARQMRRLAAAMHQPVEIVFLTSSEGDSLAWLHDFPVVKVPSKTGAHAGGLEPARYRRLARQCVWSAFSAFAPDLLVVDTFPAGSLRELRPVLDMGQRNVFVYRAVRGDAAAAPEFQSALRAYHRIVVPHEFGQDASPVPDDLAERVHPCGPILLRSRDETLSPGDARERLGLPPDATAVYVSTGGGGDQEADAFFAQILRAARRLPDLRFVFGAGPLYRGAEPHAPNVAWTRRPALMECFRAFDAAVTAGGFNSVWELMHCGVPCLLAPRPRSHDDQERRAALCADAGAGTVLDSLDPDTVAAALTALLEPARRDAAARAARTLAPVNDALTAAADTLAAVLPPARVETAALLVDPARCAAAAADAIPEEDLLRVAARLLARRPAPHDAGAAEDALDDALERLRDARERGTATATLLAALHDAPENPDGA